MSDATLYLLLGTAASTGMFHILIPDHWLPFVLIGRARNWTVRRTMAVSGLSALIHVGLSILLGMLALALGLTAVAAVGETLEQSGAILLIVFGLFYSVWAWRKGGHFHPGGAKLHAHEDSQPCEGAEGDANPDHLHYHADDGMIRSPPRWSAVGLAVIVGVNPCVLFVPLILATADRGPDAVLLVSLAYSVPTTVLMISLSAIGVAGARRIRLPGAARHMEAISGLLVAALGVAYLFLDH